MCWSRRNWPSCSSSIICRFRTLSYNSWQALFAKNERPPHFQPHVAQPPPPRVSPQHEPLPPALRERNSSAFSAHVCLQALMTAILRECGHNKLWSVCVIGRSVSVNMHPNVANVLAGPARSNSRPFGLEWSSVQAAPRTICMQRNEEQPFRSKKKTTAYRNAPAAA